MNSFFSNSEVIFYTVATTTAIFGIVVSIIKYIQKIFKFLRERYIYIDSIHKKVEKIFEEITPNHGTSIKDKVNSLDTKINKMEDNLIKNTTLTGKIFYGQRWLLDNSDIAIFETDKTGRYIWVNNKYLNLVKKDFGSIIGHGWESIVSPEERDRVINKWQTCVQDKLDIDDSFIMNDAEGKRQKVFYAARKAQDDGYIGYLKIYEDEDTKFKRNC